MKIFSAEQIREWDQYSIQHEPIASLDLMNRAAAAFTNWMTALYPNSEQPVLILAGTGNNGGDGLAVARMLHARFYSVSLYIFDFSQKHSADFDAQLKLLPAHKGVDVIFLTEYNSLPGINPKAIVVDALFGTGLSRALAEPWASLIEDVNALPNDVLAIDLPSGLFADRMSTGPCIRAKRSFSFQIPKLAFFFPENEDKVGEWTFSDIGLHPEYSNITESPFHYTTENELKAVLRPRKKFSHKGTYGHALLIAGSRGKMGAAVLATRACTRAGTGLVSVHVAACGVDILQISVPEAMCSIDEQFDVVSQIPELSPYQAVGMGPGIGKHTLTQKAVERLLCNAIQGLVLDADALNLLAENPDWWELMPKGTILTPHPKEFERLFGKTADSFERNQLQRRKSVEHGIVIVLKGAYTAISTPDGCCYFNSTGNPGMATGGSGDVLTGMITGLLAQGYSPKDAAIIGVWQHGRAGDVAARQRGMDEMVAGDLI